MSETLTPEASTPETLEAGAPDPRTGRGLTKTLSLPGWYAGALFVRRQKTGQPVLLTDHDRIEELARIQTHLIEGNPIAESEEFRAWWARRASKESRVA